MDSRAWRLAAGAGLGLLALVGLVAWRAADLAGGWLWALRLTALLAVVGLLSVLVLAGRAGLRPPVRREVVVRVPRAGADEARVLAPAATASVVALRSLLLVAVLSAAPLLTVLVLAAPTSDRLDVAGGQVQGESTAPASPTRPAETSPSPSTASPPAATASGAPVPGALGTSSAGASSASATPSPSTTPSPAATGPPSVPTPSATSPPDTGSAAQAGDDCHHVVTAGETLSGITASRLGARASPGAVEAGWRALWRANRAGVGADPDLIHPGLVLTTCT